MKELKQISVKTSEHDVLLIARKNHPAVFVDGMFLDGVERVEFINHFQGNCEVVLTFNDRVENNPFPLNDITLLEMLVVLLIISVLLLLFVPNLTKQKEAVNDKGKAAVVKVVESQAELYSLDKNEDASLSKLQADGRITEEQAKAYKEYHVKQGTSQSVSD